MEVEIMLSTVTTKGQVTIPKKMRDALQIKPNEKIDFIQDGNRIILVPLKTLKDFRGAVKSETVTGSFQAEREKAKTAVGKRVAGEMK
jgi:AbrB family looped-hinge helix DNA binding protein